MMERTLSSCSALPDRTRKPRARASIVAWLLACCLLVYAMVVVGGVTRLTHSGLSITEWQPIVGAVPPLSDAAWQDAFAKYQQTPEYQQVNRHMTLAEFKPIFWMEWAHRFLGRMIGLVFLIPFLWFLARGRLDSRLAFRLAGVFVLGALQGLMGWYMVKSGLVDDPRVSQYRLVAHLALALLIYGALLWLVLGLTAPRAAAGSTDPIMRKLRRFSVGLIALVFVTLLSGGFVAGIRAGFAYNTFPLMNGHVVPPEIFMLDPWWLNFFNNMATVQFNHRLLALLLALLVSWFWLRVGRTPLPTRAKLASHALLATLALQIALGISTLLLIVPIPLAAAHQATAVALYSCAIWTVYEIDRA